MPDSLRPTSHPAGHTPTAEAAQPHFLIVDDNPVNRQILEFFLQHLGATWLSVEDGAQAVAAAKQRRFDAILMDIQMPVMDGLTATQEIRRWERSDRRPQTPIIVVSANSEPEDVGASRAAGAQQHVAKPVTMAVLFAALSTACDSEQGLAAA